MRLLTLAVGVFLAAVPAAGRRVRAGDYIGTEHPSGELRLQLRRSGDFLLRLSVWDPVVRAYVAERELAGRWRCTLRGIVLVAPARTIRYDLVSEPPQGWRWERSNLPTFADGITLERQAPVRRAH